MTVDEGRRLRGQPPQLARDLDRKAIEEIGIPGLLLMEHASLGAAILAVRTLGERGTAPETARVQIACGPGNNGGDGYAMARHLHNAGVQVTVWDLVDPRRIDPSSDAGVNRRILIGMGIEPIHLTAISQFEPDVDLLVDAIFGTGLTRPPEGIYAAAIDSMNTSPTPVLAVDIPSGLRADDGRPLGPTIEADRTVTFGVMKQGLLAAAAARFTGDLFCVPIGVPRELLPEDTPAFPPAPVRVLR